MQDKDAQYLIRKELMMHKDCYTDYVRCLREDTTTSQPNELNRLGDFCGVKEYTDETILCTSSAVSMSVLHKIYGTGYAEENARSYRAKLKAKIISEYGDKLLFFTIDGKSPQVIISPEGLNTSTVLRDKSKILKEAAKYLSEDILDFASNYKLPWPLTPDTLSSQVANMPKSVKDFFSAVLKSEDHSLSDSMKRLVTSYSSDLITGVTRGKVVTLKHFLIGVGLHNITGLKTPIKILSHLGHCIDYNLVCEVETAQAEAALKSLEEQTNELNVTDQLASSRQRVLTFWWADNFNQTIETQTGHHGAIDSTHIVEFSDTKIACASQVGLKNAFLKY